jgi:hypothetical protein
MPSRAQSPGVLNLICAAVGTVNFSRCPIFLNTRLRRSNHIATSNSSFHVTWRARRRSRLTSGQRYGRRLSRRKQGSIPFVVILAGLMAIAGLSFGWPARIALTRRPRIKSSRAYGLFSASCKTGSRRGRRSNRQRKCVAALETRRSLRALRNASGRPFLATSIDVVFFRAARAARADKSRTLNRSRELGILDLNSVRHMRRPGLGLASVAVSAIQELEGACAQPRNKSTILCYGSAGMIATKSIRPRSRHCMPRAIGCLATRPSISGHVSRHCCVAYTTRAGTRPDM